MTAEVRGTLNWVLLEEFKKLLYVKPLDDIRKRLYALGDHNGQLVGNQQRCFLYRGEMFAVECYPKGKVPRPINWLRPELHADMQRLQDEKHEIENLEMPYVLGYLQRVMQVARTQRDYLALIPNVLHAPIKKHATAFANYLEDLPDTEVAAFLQDNDRYLGKLKERMTFNLLL